jgi:hypothetical protein
MQDLADVSLQLFAELRERFALLVSRLSQLRLDGIPSLTNRDLNLCERNDLVAWHGRRRLLLWRRSRRRLSRRLSDRRDCERDPSGYRAQAHDCRNRHACHVDLRVRAGDGVAPSRRNAEVDIKGGTAGVNVMETV